MIGGEEQTSRLDKYFDYQNIEPQTTWEYPTPSPDAPAYFIPMPPPNITGELHLGHALFATLQDILARYHRQRGHDTLFLPGFDHAGSATQAKMTATMEEMGISDREAFTQYWEKRHCDRIQSQLEALGTSANWEKSRFTLDERYQKATIHAFHTLQNKGLIYEQDGKYYLKLKELAQPLIDAIASGGRNAIASGEIKIYPQHLAKKFTQTPDGESLLNARDWEISREDLWYGHKIPGTNLGMDTWFSSCLWCFASLGWPENTPELQRYFPAAILETGSDITFFWAARMTMLSYALTGKPAFKTLYLHGLIRDNQGQKMSKSLGNGTQPELLLKEYGADALRFYLAANTSPGADTKINYEQLLAAKRFTNKIWNAAKFIQAQDQGKPQTCDLETEDQQLLQEIATLRAQIYSLLDDYDFRTAANTLRDFFWYRFCDQYLEQAKTRIKSHHNSQGAIATLHTAMHELLQLLHPFMPFITTYLTKNI